MAVATPPPVGMERRVTRALVATLRALRAAGEPLPTLALPPPAWELFIAVARAHGVLAMLHPHAVRLHDVAPATVLSAAAQSYRHNAARNMGLRMELGRVLRLLAEREVAVLPLKGLVLSDTVYRDANLRSATDIDLLAPPPHFRPALTALLSDGYQELQPEIRGHVLNRGVAVALCRSAPPSVQLDLHPVLGLGHRALTAQMLGRASIAQLAGGPARLLALDDVLLLLCLHLWKHGFYHLRWFVDIAELTTHAGPRLDWERLRATARTAQVSLVVGAALQRTQDYLGLPIPPSLGPSLGGGTRHTLVCGALRAFVPLSMHEHTPFRPVDQLFFHVTAAGREDHARAREILRAFWPAPATLQARQRSAPPLLRTRSRPARLARLLLALSLALARRLRR